MPGSPRYSTRNLAKRRCARAVFDLPRVVREPTPAFRRNRGAPKALTRDSPCHVFFRFAVGDSLPSLLNSALVRSVTGNSRAVSPLTSTRFTRSSRWSATFGSSFLAKEFDQAIKAERRKLRRQQPSKDEQLRTIPPASDGLQVVAGPRSSKPSGPPEMLHFLQNDHGNYERLVALYGDDLRYLPTMKKWFCWDGHRWASDNSGQARRLAKATIADPHPVQRVGAGQLTTTAPTASTSSPTGLGSLYLTRAVVSCAFESSLGRSGRPA